MAATCAPPMALALSATNIFSDKIYPVLATDTNTNLVTSIYNLASVMSIVLAGSGGSTSHEIRHSFGLDDDNDDEEALFEGFRKLSSFVRGNDNFTLEVASKMFVQDGFLLLQSFLDVTSRSFGIKVVENVDFARTEEAAEVINGWVSVVTNGKINDLVNLDSLDEFTKFILVSAIYFKGTWERQFDAKYTSEMDFQISDGRTVKVEMMHRTGYYKVHQNQDLRYKILEIPYKGDRLTMLLFLSHTPEGFSEMEEKFNTFDFAKLLKTQLYEDQVQIYVPKFKVETRIQFSEPLIKIGLASMFDWSAANFSRMTGPSNLYVSSVLQKAFVEVNEVGTEAAAATMVQWVDRCGPLGEIRFDRPFLFAIVDKLTGLVLFRGRIVDPLTKS